MLKLPVIKQQYKMLKWLAKAKFKAPDVNDIPLPEVFELEPTNTCNLRCEMCHVSFMDLDKPMIFDISLLKKLDALRGKWMCVGSVFEPIMHPQFDRIITELSNMDCNIDFTTNGTLLTEKLVEQIAGSNIQSVNVSFDAMNKETYEKIRRRAQFETTLKKVLYLRVAFEKRRTFFTINYIMSRRNIDELIDAIDFWERNNFHQIRFAFMVLRSLDQNILKESLYPVREYAFKKLDEAALHIINNNHRITLSSPYYNYSELKNSYQDNFSENYVHSDNPKSRPYFNPKHHYQRIKYPGMKVACSSPFVFARILWNGNVQLCYKFVVGNLHKKDFKDIWYGKKAQRIRNIVLANPEICFSCDYFRFCLYSTKIDINEKINYFQQDLVEQAKKINFS